MQLKNTASESHMLTILNYTGILPLTPAGVLSEGASAQSHSQLPENARSRCCDKNVKTHG